MHPAIAPLSRRTRHALAHAVFAGAALTAVSAHAQIADQAQRFVPMQGTLNTRDIGGYQTVDGREVAWHRMYRSANLSQITGQDQAKLQSLNIETIVDFRGPREAEIAPDRVPAGMRYIDSPIIGDAKGDGLDRRQVERLLEQAGLPAGMHDEKKVNAIGPYYRMLVLVNNYGTDDHLARLKGYKPLFQQLLALPDDKSVLFHCTGGRDRTGVATALILKTLGVPDGKIKDDFVASNYYLQPDRDNPDSVAFRQFSSANLFIQPPQNKQFQAFAAQVGATPEQIRDAVVLKPELLDRLFQGIDRKYGSFDNFLRVEMGVGPREVALLRAKYTQ